MAWEAQQILGVIGGLEVFFLVVPFNRRLVSLVLGKIGQMFINFISFTFIYQQFPHISPSA